MSCVRVWAIWFSYSSIPKSFWVCKECPTYIISLENSIVPLKTLAKMYPKRTKGTKLYRSLP